MCDQNNSVSIQVNKSAFNVMVCEDSKTSFYKQFPKHSFMRFCDDFVELILQYLSFKDSVVFECVSKQWQRVVYNKRTQLNISEQLLKDIEVIDENTGLARSDGLKAIDKQAFESVLKKCKSIETVYSNCYFDAKDLELIGIYCEFLNKFRLNTIGFEGKSLVKFGLKYGYRLKCLNICGQNISKESIENFLKYCINLREIDVCFSDYNNFFIKEDMEYLPKLETIGLLDFSSLSELEKLVNKYCNTIKTISICLNLLNGFQCCNALSLITQFRKLESLFIIITVSEQDEQVIDDSICELAKKCSTLRKLDFYFYSMDHIITNVNNKIFHAFANFRSLQKLRICFDAFTKTLEGSVECFKMCQNLKSLEIFYNELSDQFLDKIYEFIPNLEKIQIQTKQKLSDHSLQSLSSLKQLKYIFWNSNLSLNKEITDSGIRQVINSCPDIRSISLFYSLPNITQTTIEAFIELALKKPKIKVLFQYGCDVNGDRKLPKIDLNHFSLPQNLTVEELREISWQSFLFNSL